MKTGDSQGPGGDGFGTEGDRVHGSDGGMGEEEGSTRGETEGPDTTDDGDGGPDDESDGEVGGFDKGGFDRAEGGWGRRAGERRR